MSSTFVCSRHGCPQILERGAPHPGCPLELGDDCPSDEAARRRKANKRRPSSRRRGYDARWQATSRAYRKAHPICEEPGCRRRSAEVHHLDGLGPNGPRGHDWANLQALCSQHHAQHTAREQGGGWHA